jgi:hypothetical protein
VERSHAQILQFVRLDESLDPETLAILGAAYDKALSLLRDAGQPIMIGRLSWRPFYS